MTPTHVIVHHSLTRDSGTVSWGAIRRYHVVNMRWKDIGYHFGVEFVDGTPEILLGRLPDEAGAHCKEGGMNHRSIGVCIVGNFDEQPPPVPVWNRAVALCAWLCKEYSIPSRNVLGHRHFAVYKSCPGEFFDMDKFREDIDAQL